MLRVLTTMLCVIAAACAPEDSESGKGGSDESVASDDEQCDMLSSCTDGLTCAEGRCVQCGTGRAVPGKICLEGPTVVATPGAREIHLAQLPDGPGIFLHSRGEVDFRFLRPDFRGDYSIVSFEGATERGFTRLFDIEGDGDDDVLYSRHNQSGSYIARFEVGAPVLGEPIIASTNVAPMPPAGMLPARVFYSNNGEFRWRWLYPTGDVDGGRVPFSPRDDTLVADLDGDGAEELVLVTSEEELVVLQPTDDGLGFDVAATAELDRLYDAIVADVDESPGHEILLPIGRTELRIIDFDGSAIEISDPISSPYDLFMPAVGDLDADGRPDIVMASNGPATEDSTSAELDRIVVLLQTMPGKFETKLLFPPVVPRRFVVANLDEDPELELLGVDADAVYLFDNDL